MPRLFTLREISAAYGISARSLTQQIADGDLVPVRIGRAYKVSQAELLAWIARRTGTVR